jgi:hypothetical protein
MMYTHGTVIIYHANEAFQLLRVVGRTLFLMASTYLLRDRLYT